MLFRSKFLVLTALLLSTSQLELNAAALQIQNESEINVNLTDSQYWLNSVGLTDEAKFNKGKGIRIAVLDDGVDGTHPALQGRVAEGIDFVYSDGDKIPANSDSSLGEHGTAVAAIASSSTWKSSDENTFVGIRGVAPESIVIPVRVLGHESLNQSEETLAYRITKGIEWSINVGKANIVLMSLGVRDTVSGGICETIGSYKDKAIFVAAAGNSGFLNAGPEMTLNGLPYPAGCENVISVGALESNLQPAPFSTFDKSVDISAPGVRILTAIPVKLRKELPLSIFNGTSMAAPIVAGAAALIIEKFQGIEIEMVNEILIANAKDVYKKGPDTKTGNGVLDVSAALGFGETKKYEDNISYLFTPVYDTENKRLYTAWTESEKLVDKYTITIRHTEGTISKSLNGDQIRYIHTGDIGRLLSVWLEIDFKDGTRAKSPPVGGIIKQKRFPTNEIALSAKWSKNNKDLDIHMELGGLNIPFRKYTFVISNELSKKVSKTVTADSSGKLPKFVTIKNLDKSYDSKGGSIFYRNNLNEAKFRERFPITLTHLSKGDYIIISGRINSTENVVDTGKLMIKGGRSVGIKVQPNGTFIYVLKGSEVDKKIIDVQVKIGDLSSRPNYQIKL